MRLEAAVLREHAAADVAGEGPLPAVRLQVDLQVTGRLEALPAEAAAVRSVHGVLLLVCAQLRDGAQSHPAQRANARYGRRVRQQVLAQRAHACG